VSVETAVTAEEIDRFHARLDREAESGGYHLNPDVDFTRDLVRGLIVNERRYGYPSCPCRLASGDRSEDLDIICPCDYRDADVLEHGACYCALYVSEAVLRGEREVTSVPERRPPEEERTASGGTSRAGQDQLTTAGTPAVDGGPAGDTRKASPFRFPVWRCRVCGYLCAREGPPEVCPVCKAKKDRFERFT
jgi:ferredoxin-thioredoxin reductase catalytic subunit/rubredoxin